MGKFLFLHRNSTQKLKGIVEKLTSIVEFNCKLQRRVNKFEPEDVEDEIGKKNENTEGIIVDSIDVVADSSVHGSFHQRRQKDFAGFH